MLWRCATLEELPDYLLAISEQRKHLSSNDDSIIIIIIQSSH